MNTPVKKRGNQFYYTLVLLLPLIFALFCIDVVCVIYILHWQKIRELGEESFFLLLFAIAAALHIVVYYLWSIAGKNANTRFSLDGDDLVVQNPEGIQRIPLVSIEKITFSPRRWFEHWMKIKGSGNLILVTIFQMGIPVFLMDLKIGFDRSEAAIPADDFLFKRFFRRALNFEQAGERFREHFSAIMALYIGLPALLYVINLALTLRLIDYVFWIISGSIMVLFSVILAEKIISGKVNSALLNDPFSIPPRDRDWEKTVYINTLFWGVLIFIGASVVVIVVNMLMR